MYYYSSTIRILQYGMNSPKKFGSTCVVPVQKKGFNLVYLQTDFFSPVSRAVKGEVRARVRTSYFGNYDMVLSDYVIINLIKYVLYIIKALNHR